MLTTSTLGRLRHILPAVLLLVSGCSVDSSAISPGGGAMDGSTDVSTSDVTRDVTADTTPPPDGAADTAPPTDTSIPDGAPPDAAVCSTWSARHFDPCAIPPPGPAITVMDGTYDTDTGTLDDGGSTTSLPGMVIDQGGTDARLISLDGFTVMTGLRVVGRMPLIVASWGDIAIDGDLDVSSRRGAAGAGANPGVCTTATSGDTGDGGTGGGGGGGFGGRGGDGGDADDNGGRKAGGTGGDPLGSTPTIVRGGCPGANAGRGDAGDEPVGGFGGGAVQLSARMRIDIVGRVNAGGAGGQGGARPSATGGGGGGSGGYIGLDAPMVTVSGTLAANGGGGGGGAAFAEGGSPGGNGRLNAAPANGGAGASGVGTSGGQGGANTAIDGSGVGGILDGGGGGGGGGAGFIVVYASTFDSSSATISPSATTP